MKPRLAIVCLPGLDSFVKPLVPLWAPYFSIRTFLIECDDDVRRAYEFVGEGGTIFCEWANLAAIKATGHVWSPGVRIVVRLHSYEAFQPAMLNAIDWTRVSAVATVAEHVREIASEACPAIPEMVVVPNGVDLAKYEYKERKHGIRIGVAGYISHKKGPMLWLQVLHEVREAGYQLHVAGSFQDDRYRRYLLHMARELEVADQFHLEGWQTDMAAWWADKNFCLSASPHEGHPLNVLEAAALGVQPVVHAYYGSAAQYPEDWLWDSPARASEIIHPFRGALMYDSAGARAWAEEFPIERTADALRALLVG